MLEEKYLHLKKKFGTFEGAMGFQNQERPTITTSEVLKPNFNLEQLRADELARGEQKQRDLEAYFESHIFYDIFGAQKFEYPVPSVKQVVKESEKWSIHQLKQGIELNDVEIKRRQEAKKIRAATYTREKLERSLWRRESIAIETKSEGRVRHFYVNSLEEIEELLALEEEAQQILDARIAYFTAIKEGYRARLREMENAAPAILDQKLCEISQVVKDAKETIRAIRKTAARNQKSHDVKGKEAVRFVDNREQVKQLQSRYINLHSEISNYANLSSLSIPLFPNDLSMEERTCIEEIEQAADRERKGVQNIPSGLRK